MARNPSIVLDALNEPLWPNWCVPSLEHFHKTSIFPFPNWPMHLALEENLKVDSIIVPQQKLSSKYMTKKMIIPSKGRGLTKLKVDHFVLLIRISIQFYEMDMGNKNGKTTCGMTLD